MLTGLAAGLSLGVLVGVLQACRPLRKAGGRCRFFVSAAILIVGALSVVALELGSRGRAYAQSASSTGQWSALQTWPYLAVQAQMLPTGKVMFWPGSAASGFADGDNPHLWDPTTATISATPRAGFNIFCSGFSLLTDGTVLVTGGHIESFVGFAYATIYNPFTNSWSRIPDMNAGRWYPSTMALANGDAVVLSGQQDTAAGMNLLPQVWQPLSGTWRSLTSAQLQVPYYPYIFLAPNGKVFNAGPSQTTRYLDTSGTGAWSLVGNNNFGARNWGSAVMYEPGKVLVMGGIQGAFYPGSATPTATAEHIDLNAASPSWQYRASMSFPRKHHNATLLPNGQVLVTGGSSGSEGTNSNSGNPAYAAETWDPTTNTWTTLASDTVFRGYHAIALLLPDGRVLSGGGDYGGPTANVFSPPYLFQGARPTITSVPATIGLGQTFFLGTPDAMSVGRVTWLRLGSVTHGFNMGQRFASSGFTQATGGLNVTAPANANIAPPGYYMLFILNAAGVPSVAQIVRLDAAAATPTAPLAPSNLTGTVASSSQINLAWTDNSTNESGFKIERCQGAGCTNFAQIATVAAGVTTYANTGLATSTTYQYRVRAYNSDGDSAYSNTVSATTGVTGPAAPSSLKATAVSSSQINLTWADNSTNETGFKIERCQGGKNCKSFTEIAQVGANVRSYSSTGLAASTTYTHRVRAFNAAGNSGYSNKATATTAAAAALAPAAPSNLTAAVASSTPIKLAWTDNRTNESSFNIERCQGAGCTTFAQIATVGTAVTAYSNTGPPARMTYERKRP